MKLSGGPRWVAKDSLVSLSNRCWVMGRASNSLPSDGCARSRRWRGERGECALANGSAYAADLIRGVSFIDAGRPVPR
jgi:hypothetical protein